MSMAAGVAALIAILGHDDPVTWITVVFALVGLVPWVLELRRVRVDPMLFVAMTMLPAAAVVLLDRNPGGLFPAYLAIVWITRRGSPRAVVAAAVAAVVGMAIGYGLAAPEETEGTIYFLGGIGVAWLGGVLLHRQEMLVAELREATERERGRAAVEERTRIAREVHDVVAHSLTITLLHVTGARRAMASDPHRAAAALEQAETVGRESLDSIRQIVGLLRDSDGQRGASGRRGDAPLPDVSDIPSLVAQYRDAGLHVEASCDLDDVSTGAMTSLTVFRLVQEAMTNSLRHAPGSPLSLDIRVDEDRSVICLTAENPVRETVPRGSNDSDDGLGLVGMAERVRAAGGSIEVGPTSTGTWRVAVELPFDLARERP
jgi:signal transduction histidine kinase